jgi:hypothetical protein
MRVKQIGGMILFQGKLKEEERINTIKSEDHRFMIMADDSEDDEISLSCVLSGATQKEKAELFSEIKRALNNAPKEV